MSLPRRLLPALLVPAFAILPLRADADPVQITSGFLAAAGLQSADFRFVGADFDAAGLAELGVVGPSHTCFPCSAGDPIDLSSFFAGTIGSGTAVVDGTSYPRVVFGGSLTFTAPSVIAPSTAGAFTVTQPFTFSASLLGFLNYNMTNEQIAFERLLTGQGSVTAAFRPVPNDPSLPAIFSFDSVRYEFTSADPVPEPTTLLLVGSGLALALRRRVTSSRVPLPPRRF